MWRTCSSAADSSGNRLPEDSQTTRALVEAARDGHLSQVEQLLRMGVSAEAGQTSGYTALGLAVNRGHVAIAEQLLKFGADPDTPICANDVTPLMVSAVWNRVAMAEILLQHGCSLTVQGTAGSYRDLTALDIARDRGNHTVAQLIVRHRARRRLRRLTRCARTVNTFALALLELYAHVHFRPGAAGAQAALTEFDLTCRLLRPENDPGSALRAAAGPSISPSLSPRHVLALGDTEHSDRAARIHAHCYATLPIADAYRLSAEDAGRDDALASADSVDLTYGDVPFGALAAALALAEPRGTKCSFIDLGSGVGRGVIAAALLRPFKCCVGVEILLALHDAAAGEPARRWASMATSARLAAETGAKPALPQAEAAEEADDCSAGMDARGLAGSVRLVCADLFSVSLRALQRGESCFSVDKADDSSPHASGHVAATEAAEAASSHDVVVVSGVAHEAAATDEATDEEDLVVFICCVTWPPPLMARLAAKLAAECADGTRICTVGQRLPLAVDLPEAAMPPSKSKGKGTSCGGGAVQFQETGRCECPFEWGKEVVVCHRVVRLGRLAARRMRKQKQ